LSNLGTKLVLQRLRPLLNCSSSLLGGPALTHRGKSASTLLPKGNRGTKTLACPVTVVLPGRPRGDSVCHSHDPSSSAQKRLDQEILHADDRIW